MGYEGVIHVMGIPGPPIRIKVIAFGTLVIDGRINMPVTSNPAFITREFAFMHFGTSSTVITTISVPTFNP